MLAAELAPFLVSGMLAATSPGMPDIVPQGDLLNEGEQCFSLYSDAHSGGQLFGHSYQRIERLKHDGEPALRVVIHQQGSLNDFSLREEFLLHADDLQPISMSSVARRNGKVIERVSLTYGVEKITGTREQADKARNGKPGMVVSNLEVPHSGPIWEGNLLGPVIAALPLEEDAFFELPQFQHERGFGKFQVAVLGSEMREVDGEQTRVFFVHAGRQEGTKLNYVIADKPRKELSYSSLGIRQVPGGPGEECSDPAESSADDAG